MRLPRPRGPAARATGCRRCEPAPPPGGAPWPGTASRPGPAPTPARRQGAVTTRRRCRPGHQPSDSGDERHQPRRAGDLARRGQDGAASRGRRLQPTRRRPCGRRGRGGPRRSTSDASAPTRQAAVSRASSRGSCSAPATGRTSSTSTPSTWPISATSRSTSASSGNSTTSSSMALPATALEDVDADDVSAHGTDAAGDRRRARRVGPAATGARRTSTSWPGTYGSGVNGGFRSERLCEPRAVLRRPRPYILDRSVKCVPTVPLVDAPPHAAGRQRRSQLMAYATGTVRGQGYHPTSVAEIVDGLGVGKGVFYWYFTSKEELFVGDPPRRAARSAPPPARRRSATSPTPIRRIELGIRASTATGSTSTATSSTCSSSRPPRHGSPAALRRRRGHRGATPSCATSRTPSPTGASADGDPSPGPRRPRRDQPPGPRVHAPPQRAASARWPTPPSPSASVASTSG